MPDSPKPGSSPQETYQPDHYRVLGVHPKATDAEIKTAYRKLSRVYHPDRQGGNRLAEDCFKLIAAANADLSDPGRRLNYDRTLLLKDPLRMVDDPRAARALDVLDDVVTRLRKRQTALPGRAHGRDLRVEHALPFALAMLGGLTQVRAAYETLCPDCRGATTTEPERNPTCHVCAGQGTVKSGLRRHDMRCGFCAGRGLILMAPCRTCAGQGQVRTEKDVPLQVPPRCREGAHLRVRGGGESVPGGSTGDLLAIIHITPHPFLKAEGDDLLAQVPVTWGEAAAGARVPVATLEATEWLTLPPGTPAGREFRIAQRGLPIVTGGQPTKRGTLRVQIVIDMPADLTPSETAAVLLLESQLGSQRFTRATSYRAALTNTDTSASEA